METEIDYICLHVVLHVPQFWNHIPIFLHVQHFHLCPDRYPWSPCINIPPVIWLVISMDIGQQSPQIVRWVKFVISWTHPMLPFPFLQANLGPPVACLSLQHPYSSSTLSCSSSMNIDLIISPISFHLKHVNWLFSEPNVPPPSVQPL